MGLFLAILLTFDSLYRMPKGKSIHWENSYPLSFSNKCFYQGTEGFLV